MPQALVRFPGARGRVGENATLSLLKQHPGKDSTATKRRACGWPCLSSRFGLEYANTQGVSREVRRCSSAPYLAKLRRRSEYRKDDRRRAQRSLVQCRPRLESLEDRTLLSVTFNLSVDSTATAGNGVGLQQDQSSSTPWDVSASWQGDGGSVYAQATGSFATTQSSLFVNESAEAMAEPGQGYLMLTLAQLYRARLH